MNSQSPTLSNFLEEYLPIVKRQITDEIFLNIREGIFLTFLKDQERVGGVINILLNLKPIGSSVFYENMLLEKDKRFGCQAMLYKMNGQRIPIFIGENLEEAIRRLKQGFHLLLEDDSDKGWKFAIASNYDSWIFSGMNTIAKEQSLCSSEVFNVAGVSERKLLEPFLRNLLAVFHFDAEELSRIWMENKEKQEAQRKGASIEDLTNVLIENCKKIGGERSEAAILSIKKFTERLSCRDRKETSEKEKPL